MPETQRTAIMTAFPPEREALAHLIVDAVEHRIHGWSIVTGTLAGQAVALTESGISMVNAAMHTQLLIERFAIARIVFSGIAGGVDPTLSIGDVVVPERWGQNFEVAFSRETGTGYAPPLEIPGGTDLPGYGALFPRDVIVGSADAPMAQRRWFDADAGLLDLARRVGATLDHPRVVVGGNGVSGSAFVDNAGYRAYLAETYGARVVDMESAAVAQVAFANGVPFLAFRSVSDLAGGDADSNRMLAFMATAAANAAHLVRAFVGALV